MKNWIRSIKLNHLGWLLISLVCVFFVIDLGLFYKGQWNSIFKGIIEQGLLLLHIHYRWILFVQIFLIISLLVCFAMMLKKGNNRILKFIKEHIVLFFFVITSVLLLLFFAYLYCKSNLSVLSIDNKWIIVSMIPVLLGLIIGGYITKFKGFGIELEANLKKYPIPENLFLKNSHIALFKKGMQKMSTNILEDLSDERKKEVNTLQFTLKKQNYYGVGAIEEYLIALPNLLFVELVDAKNKFKYLISISKWKQDDNYNLDLIESFIQKLELDSFTNSIFKAVEDSVSKSDSVIDIYTNIKSSPQSGWLLPGKESLPVLDGNRHLVGVVDTTTLVDKIIQDIKAL